MGSIFEQTEAEDLSSTFLGIVNVLKEQLVDHAPEKLAGVIKAAEEEVARNKNERALELLRCYSMGIDNYRRSEALTADIRALSTKEVQTASEIAALRKEQDVREAYIEELETTLETIDSEADPARWIDDIIPDDVDFREKQNGDILLKRVQTLLSQYTREAALFREFKPEVMPLVTRLAELGTSLRDDAYTGTHAAERQSVAEIFRGLLEIEKRATIKSISVRKAGLEKDGPSYDALISERYDKIKSIQEQRVEKLRDMAAIFDSNGSLSAYSEETRREMYDEFVTGGRSMEIYRAYVRAANCALQDPKGMKSATFFRTFYDELKQKGIHCLFGLETLKENHDDVYLLFRANNRPKLHEDGRPLKLAELFEIEVSGVREAKLEAEEAEKLAAN